jgi:hypothetical protein
MLKFIIICSMKEENFAILLMYGAGLFIFKIFEKYLKNGEGLYQKKSNLCQAVYFSMNHSL